MQNGGHYPWTVARMPLGRSWCKQQPRATTMPCPQCPATPLSPPHWPFAMQCDASPPWPRLSGSPSVSERLFHGQGGSQASPPQQHRRPAKRQPVMKRMHFILNQSWLLKRFEKWNDYLPLMFLSTQLHSLKYWLRNETNGWIETSMSNIKHPILSF